MSGRHPRATFIRVVWEIGTVDYIEPARWAMLVKINPQIAKGAVSIAKKRKAYTVDKDIRIPTNYTTRSN